MNGGHNLGIGYVGVCRERHGGSSGGRGSGQLARVQFGVNNIGGLWMACRLMESQPQIFIRSSCPGMSPSYYCQTDQLFTAYNPTPTHPRPPHSGPLAPHSTIYIMCFRSRPSLKKHNLGYR
jgi:hypothetical protein